MTLNACKQILLNFTNFNKFYVRVHNSKNFDKLLYFILYIIKIFKKRILVNKYK